MDGSSNCVALNADGAWPAELSFVFLERRFQC